MTTTSSYIYQNRRYKKATIDSIFHLVLAFGSRGLSRYFAFEHCQISTKFPRTTRPMTEAQNVCLEHSRLQWQQLGKQNTNDFCSIDLCWWQINQLNVLTHQQNVRCFGDELAQCVGAVNNIKTLQVCSATMLVTLLYHDCLKMSVKFLKWTNPVFLPG